jgi:hypothetical protein
MMPIFGEFGRAESESSYKDFDVTISFTNLSPHSITLKKKMNVGKHGLERSAY